jgi:hypothetical protein
VLRFKGLEPGEKADVEVVRKPLSRKLRVTAPPRSHKK